MCATHLRQNRNGVLKRLLRLRLGWCSGNLPQNLFLLLKLLAPVSYTHLMNKDSDHFLSTWARMLSSDCVFPFLINFWDRPVVGLPELWFFCSGFSNMFFIGIHLFILSFVLYQLSCFSSGLCRGGFCGKYLVSTTSRNFETYNIYIKYFCYLWPCGVIM